MHPIRHKRVLIMGLGRFGGGVGAARFCVEHGAADVLVTDQLAEDALQDAMVRLADLPIRYRLGGHLEADFAQADLVVVNPAVDRRGNRFVRVAERAGATLTSEIELLIQRLPNRERTIGVTGAAGKSTVTAMIGHALAREHGPGRVHVGGNLGGSLLTQLQAIGRDDWVVLELSSFMLEALADAGAGWSPHIGVVTNIAENHLDRHGDMDGYIRAKKTILVHQEPHDRAVVGGSVADWGADTAGRVVVVEEPLAAPLKVVGPHNGRNAAIAVAACEEAGLGRERAVEAVGEFRGLPHRLQQVAEHAGRSFYNDSKSTTPEAAILALASFPPRRVHVLLGGYDKKADLHVLAQHAAERAAGIYTIGHTGDAIAAAAGKNAHRCPVRRCGTLEVAVREAVAQARAGQVVLLSPGCASWGDFENYEQRGRAFAELVLRHTTETGTAAAEPATGG